MSSLLEQFCANKHPDSLYSVLVAVCKLLTLYHWLTPIDACI
jgi:hypothetical protein